jgi:cytochrome oxidase Cu insertion factor (SCO1/SenC/PrrC family)
VSRRAAAIGAIAVLVGALAVVIVTASIRDEPSATGESSLTSGSGPFRGSEPPDGLAMPDFTLRNYDGRLVSSDELRGRVLLLTFLDSQCTESCPLIAWTVARALDGLTSAERADVQAVAISADPAEDTRASVRTFLARNRAVGRLLYLGGGERVGRLSAVWKEFQVLSSLESGQDTLHSAPVRIYDRRGMWVATLHAGADLTQPNLVHDLRVALGL